jgi:hypothetical protein
MVGRLRGITQVGILICLGIITIAGCGQSSTRASANSQPGGSEAVFVRTIQPLFYALDAFSQVGETHPNPTAAQLQPAANHVAAAAQTADSQLKRYSWPSKAHADIAAVVRDDQTITSDLAHLEQTFTPQQAQIFQRDQRRLEQDAVKTRSVLS